MFESIIPLIEKAEKIALFTHVNPDGDALGSSFALKIALCGAGKKCEVFLEEECRTKEFSLIAGKEPSGLEIDDCDLKIALDCSGTDRLGALGDRFRGNIAAIDHHVTETDFRGCLALDSSAAATGELVYELLNEMNIPITHDIANNLYVAISSDTGSFKYSSTTPRTMRIAASLLETGIDFAEIARVLYDSKTREYLDLYKKAIDSLEFYDDGKISLLALSNEDFDKAGLDATLASAVVTLPGSVKGVLVSAYIRQRKDLLKVSLRSNCDIDVAEIAERFGGGGHIHAAGYSSKKPVDELKREVLAAIRESMI